MTEEASDKIIEIQTWKKDIKDFQKNGRTPLKKTRRQCLSATISFATGRKKDKAQVMECGTYLVDPEKLTGVIKVVSDNLPNSGEQVKNGKDRDDAAAIKAVPVNLPNSGENQVKNGKGRDDAA